MAGTFTLSDNPRVRYATGAIMYFSQGTIDSSKLAD